MNSYSVAQRSGKASASGPRSCGSMELVGVGYLFTRRLRRSQQNPVPDGA